MQTRASWSLLLVRGEKFTSVRVSKRALYAHCNNVKDCSRSRSMTYSKPESELVFEPAFVDTGSVARPSSSGDGIWGMWSESLHLAKRSIHMCCLNMSYAIPSLGEKRGEVLVSPSAVAMILRIHNMLPVLWDRHVEFMPWEGSVSSHIGRQDGAGSLLFS